MPAKVEVSLHWPTHHKEIVVHKKIELNGTYEDPKAQIHTFLQPGMSHSVGRVKFSDSTMKLIEKECSAVNVTSQKIHIDAEKGIQIQYQGLEKGWCGVDGRYTAAAQVGKDAEDIQSSRALKNERLVIWLGIVAVISVIANILLAAMLKK